MKKTLLLAASFFYLAPVGAQRIELPRQGIAVTLPKGWAETPVEELSKPFTLLAAVRTADKSDHLSIVAEPTNKKMTESAAAAEWGRKTAEALAMVKFDCKFRMVGNQGWFTFDGKMADGTRVLLFHTVQHFHDYGIVFMSTKGSKNIDRAALAVLESVTFTRPWTFDEIDEAFQRFHRDEMTGLMTPAGYYFTTKTAWKLAPGHVYSAHLTLLYDQPAQAVLLADDFFRLPFVLGVVTNQPALDSLGMAEACRAAVRQFEQNKIPYQEIGMAPWEKAPRRVFLHQFRSLEPEGAVMRYIFYVTKKDARLDIFQVQMPDGMERELESAVFHWVLSNLE